MSNSPTSVFNRSVTGRVHVTDVPVDVLSDRRGEGSSTRTPRVHAVLTNDGDSKCYLALGSEAVWGEGIPLEPSGSYVINFSNLTWAHVSFVCDTGGSTYIATHESFA